VNETTTPTATPTAPTEAHERTQQLLPWLVNGTLEDAERQAVEEHLAACAECRGELAATREAFAAYSAHLPPEVVMAYAEDGDAAAYPAPGEAGQPRMLERQLVERHLEQCAGCRDDVEMTRESLGALAGESGAADGASSAVATVPLQRGGGDSADGDEPWRAAPAGPVVTADSAFSPAGSRWLPFAMAACLLFAVVAGGGWFMDNERLDQRQAEIEALQDELLDARAAVETARAAAGTGGGEAAAELARYQRDLEELTAEMEGLAGQLSTEEGRVAALRDQLASADTPAIQADPSFANFMLDTTRGAGDGTEAAEFGGDGPLVVTITDDGSGLVGEGEQVTYRILDAAGDAVAEDSVTLKRDGAGLPYLGIVINPSRLPSGDLTLQILDGEDELNRYPLRLR